MNKIVLSSVVVAALGLSAAGIAQTTAVNSVSPATPSFYVGVQAGFGGIDLPMTSMSDKYDFTGRVFAGILAPVINSFNYGVEIGFMKGGDYKETGYDDVAGTVHLKIENYAADLLGVAQYSLSNNVILKGKLGLAWMDQKTKVDTENYGNYSDSEQSVGLESSVGIGYSFGNVGIDLSYNHIACLTDKLFDMSAFLVGVTYNFS